MQAGKGTGAHGGASSTGEATEEDDEEEQAKDEVGFKRHVGVWFRGWNDCG